MAQEYMRGAKGKKEKLGTGGDMWLKPVNLHTQTNRAISRKHISQRKEGSSLGNTGIVVTRTGPLRGPGPYGVGCLP